MLSMTPKTILPAPLSRCGLTRETLFHRYRQYCSRKMTRLRKALKFVHWEQGKGKSKFQQKTITAENATG